MIEIICLGYFKGGNIGSKDEYVISEHLLKCKTLCYLESV